MGLSITRKTVSADRCLSVKLCKIDKAKVEFFNSEHHPGIGGRCSQVSIHRKWVLKLVFFFTMLRFILQQTPIGPSTLGIAQTTRHQHRKCDERDRYRIGTMRRGTLSSVLSAIGAWDDVRHQQNIIERTVCRFASTDWAVCIRHMHEIDWRFAEGECNHSKCNQLIQD